MKTDLSFPKMNRAYNATFQPGRLSIGLFLPIEEYGPEDIPTLQRHIERVQLAETLGFSAVWLRDVPFNVPAFGDVGQIFDPFVYLGALAACTSRIGLGVGSVILPLRHPAHVAKAAASADVLSGGRVMLGIASGDRPEEYPALNMGYDDRGARFRDSVNYIRTCSESFPKLDAAQGRLNGHMDMLPKPVTGQVPLLITGGSQQTPEWGAEHGDGWITYPRNAENQRDLISSYRRHVAATGQGDKPVMQSLYVDVVDKPTAPTRPIVLGYQAGTPFLRDHLRSLQEMGVNHVALNLRYNFDDVEDTLKRIAGDLLPHFHIT
ncbi:LLM class oxidoreductase [Tateyamaria omphalii]|uniref:LLM class oxidoreductase n=1 Tax=Tateyamaria omphalii TaxID=299262 RepID=UPI001C9956C5|nr:LLM class oxidoreductase [Tateyamaria omphalii]MBY5932402.1 LLM class oxidoreductase [Tateyamaria omphalii]